MANTKVSSEQIIDGLALGGNPTAATQTAGNNSTRIATTAYTDAAVTALIGGAPSTLDTLNEIAAAVSDDPDYVGTVNAALALKAPKASPTFTGVGQFDSYGGTSGKGRIQFGNSGQQFIEGMDTGNGGSGSYLKFGYGSTNALTIASTGAATFSAGVTVGGNSTFNAPNINITADDARLLIEEADGTDIAYIGDITGAGVGGMFLYNHGGTATTQLRADSASTIGHGLNVTGSIRPTSHLYLPDTVAAVFGTGEDLEIYHDASDSYIKESGTGNLLIQGSDIYMGNTSSNHAFVIRNSGNVLVGQTAAGTNGKLQVTGGISTTGNSEIRQSTNSDGSTLRFLGTQLVIANSNANGYSYSGGGLIGSVSPSSGAITLDVGANSTSGHRLKVINGSDGVVGSLQYLSGTTSRFHVDSSTGNVGIGTASPSTKLEVAGMVGVAYTATGFNARSAINIKHANADTNYGSIQFTNTAGNYEKFFGAVQTSTNTADMVFQGYNRAVGGYQEYLRIGETGNVGIGFTGPSNKLAVNGVITVGNFTAASVGGTPADANTAEVGPGYINLARDDTASARQITFGKNGAVHSYLETTSAALEIGGSGSIKTRILGNGNTVFQAGSDRLFSIGSGTYEQGKIRQYVYQGTVANGATIDLFGNTSAHTDIHYYMTLEAFHSGRSYKTSVGTIGGYGWYATTTGTGVSPNNATVASGRQKLFWTNTSGFSAAVYISALIFGNNSVDVYNGALSEVV